MTYKKGYTNVIFAFCEKLKGRIGHKEPQTNQWYKKRQNDKVWWKFNNGARGKHIFSFDKEKEFNLFRDYPWSLSGDELDIFDRENPFWANYFRNRKVMNVDKIKLR